MTTIDPNREWLETDGLGGYAMGTAGGTRERRYHGLLCCATTPPTGRMLLVQGCDAELVTDDGVSPLSVQRYLPDVLHPRGDRSLVGFGREPWPTWRFRLTSGAEVEHSVTMLHGHAAVVLRWRLVTPPATAGAAQLRVRPFLGARDYHALRRSGDDRTLSIGTADRGDAVTWRPSDGPAVAARANGEYRAEPHWYRDFLYREERARGFDHVEDLLSPGTFTFDLRHGPAWLVFAPTEPPQFLLPTGSDLAARCAELLQHEERRRRAFASPLHRAAADYVVARGDGRTLVAGYPWFTDWGRDTFLAMRGLCLATGMRAAARDILCEWSRHVSQGMLPNRFPDRGADPEYHSVDASLWFVIAAHEFLFGDDIAPDDRRTLEKAILAIVRGYAVGTRHRIRMDGDALLAAGVPGLQLTWMDAVVDGAVVTPRIGKPVEVQALWLNALRCAAVLDPALKTLWQRGQAAFAQRFWNDERQCLFDVVDCDHEPGRVDASLRPNQIFAVGGLPWQVLEGQRARAVVDAVERALWTPLGLRSLARDESGYTPRYAGGPEQRDRAYHNGTVWPFLTGAFVEAWVRVRGGAKARDLARTTFVRPLLDHLEAAGLGHVSEIADAEPPHTPNGCPFQAWSLGELLRLELDVLAPPTRAPRRRAKPRAIQPR
ncbi:MAG: amylo-alpha-1,6-glucosidase [Planctomycetota bacterium]